MKIKFTALLVAIFFGFVSITTQALAVPQSPRESSQASHRIAGCVYVKMPGRVRAALDAVDKNVADEHLASLDNLGTCTNLSVANETTDEQRINIPNDIYRGVLAEALLRNEKLADKLEALGRRPSYIESWFVATGRSPVVDEMAVCIAETNPAGIRSLIKTTAETAEEKVAFSELSPSMGPCLTAGASLSANRQSLRAALAEALYHRAVSPVPLTPTAN